MKYGERGGTEKRDQEKKKKKGKEEVMVEK